MVNIITQLLASPLKETRYDIMKRLCCLLVVMFLWLGLEKSAFPDGIVAVNVTQYPISIMAGGISTWQMEGVRAFSAGGNVKITQGKMQISANNAICWFYEQAGGQKAYARMEILAQGDVVLIQGRDYDEYEEVYLHLETSAGVVVDTYGGGAISTLAEEQLSGAELKLKKIKELGLAEFAYKEPLELELEAGPPGVGPLVDIVANEIDSWMEGDTRVVVAAGDVEVRRGGQSLTADNVILWFDKGDTSGTQIGNFKEVYAEGNVKIVVAGAEHEIRQADKVFENFREGKGYFINPRIKSPLVGFPLSIYTGGREMKQISPDKFEMKDGYFTTCSFGYPHFHVSSPTVKITRRHDEQGKSYSEMKAYNNIFYVGNTPLGYMPVYKYDTRKKEALLSGYGAGKTDRYGVYVTTDWNPFVLPFVPDSLSSWSKLLINADYFDKRGPGFGSEYDYKREDVLHGLEGFFLTYYLNDKLKRDVSTPQEEVKNRNRGRILLRNRLQATEELRADIELSYLSDRDFLREFFEREFFEGKKQETYLNLRWLRDNRGAVFLVKDQLNDFQTGPEAFPELTYDMIGQPLWENRLNMTSRADVGYLRYQIDEGMEDRDKETFDRLKATTGDSFRLDLDGTLGAPFKWSIFKANPFVGGRVAAYSKSLEDGGPKGPATARFIGSLGFEGSTELWRIYSYENRLLRINGLRHIIIPQWRVLLAPLSTQTSENILQYERSDGLEDYRTATIGVRNRIQTRRGPPWKMSVVDLLELNTELHFFRPSKQGRGEVVRTVETPEGAFIPRRDSYLQTDLRAQVTNRLAVTSERNEFNLNKRNLDVFNIGLSFQKSESWRYFGGYRFIQHTSKTVTLGANVLVSKKWRANFTESFDLGARTKSGGTTSKNLFSNFSFTRESHDWIAGFSVNYDIVNRNKGFSFVLRPKGLAQAFGRSRTFTGRKP